MAEAKSEQKAASDNGEKEYRYSSDDAIAAGRALTGASPGIVAAALAETDRETHTEAQIKKAVDAVRGRAEEGADEKVYAPPEDES